jgi:hypothetical protein
MKFIYILPSSSDCLPLFPQRVDRVDPCLVEISFPVDDRSLLGNSPAVSASWNRGFKGARTGVPLKRVHLDGVQPTHQTRPPKSLENLNYIDCQTSIIRIPKPA